MTQLNKIEIENQILFDNPGIKNDEIFHGLYNLFLYKLDEYNKIIIDKLPCYLEIEELSESHLYFNTKRIKENKMIVSIHKNRISSLKNEISRADRKLNELAKLVKKEKDKMNNFWQGLLLIFLLFIWILIGYKVGKMYVFDKQMISFHLIKN